VATRQADGIDGFSPGGVLVSLGAELPTTLPAAILVATAALLNVAAGAILVRHLRQAPFASWSDLVLGGYAGAILLDAFLLFTLGGVSLFVQLALGAVLAVTIVGGLHARPLVSEALRLGRPRPARWLLIGLVWCGPLLLALASPVVPFADVLPNHVAPAEHLRVFGGFESLATYPSPLYGPSRLFLGYTALMGALSTLTGLPAALAVAASVGPLVVVSAVSARRLASAAFGRAAGFWALLAFPLSFTFVRLSDARDSVAALPLAALALATLAASSEERRVDPRPPGRPDWLLAAALTAATLVHPLVGALTSGSVVLLVLADPGRLAARAIPALAATAIAVLPQVAVMLGYAPAPAWGVVAFAAAALAAILLARIVDRGSWSRISSRMWSRISSRMWSRASSRISSRQATTGLLLAGALSVAVVAAVEPGVLAQAGQWLNPAFPLLFGAADLAIVGLFPTARSGRRLLVAPLAVGVASLLVVALIPGSSLVADSLRYEVPKAVGYWLPWVCVPAAAALVAAVVSWRGPAIVRYALVGGFLAIVLLPLGPPAPDTLQASHSVADDLAYDLRTAELGYWQGYPDPRLVVDAAGRELLDFLRVEVSSGRLGADAQVLHVARSYEPWANVPIAVFTGVEETVVSEDATPTIFTAGGRVHPLASLSAELHDGFSYVVLEPTGLPPDVRPAIISAGYRPVFANSEAEVFEASAPPVGRGWSGGGATSSTQDRRVVDI
jgi:hypothetical protein